MGRVDRCQPRKVHTPLYSSPLRYAGSLAGELICVLEHKGEVNSVAIADDLTALVAGDSTGLVSLWVPASAQILTTMDCGTGEVRATLNWLHSLVRQCRRSRRPHDGQVCCSCVQVITVDLSDDKRFFATGGIGKTAVVWELATGTKKCELDCGGMVMAAAFSKTDHNILATGAITGKACVWELSAANKILEVDVCKGPVFCVQLRRLPSGPPILATGDVAGNVVFWDITSSTGSKLRDFTPGRPVRSMDLSSDCEILVTGDKEGHVIIWTVATGAPLRSMLCGGIVYSVDLSGDKMLLATGRCQKLHCVEVL